MKPTEHVDKYGTVILYLDTMIDQDGDLVTVVDIEGKAYAQYYAGETVPLEEIAKNSCIYY